jgi:hypothetical protein
MIRKGWLIVFKNEEDTIAVQLIFASEDLARTFIDDGLVVLPAGKAQGDLAVKGIPLIH